jgi:hypothetical protein
MKRKSTMRQFLALCAVVALACSASFAQSETLSCGAHSRGFWQTLTQTNRTAIFGADDLALVNALNLKSKNGSDAPVFTSYADFQAWLQGPSPSDLSAQLVTMALSVNNTGAGYGLEVTGNAMVGAGNAPAGCDVPGLVDGLITVTDLMAAADASLGLYGVAPTSSPQHACQEFLKDALDNANNNRNFIDCGNGPADWPLEGRKFYDTNRNGVRDEGEALLEGWQFRGIGDSPMIDPAVAAANYPEDSPSLYSATVTTDSNGKFEFAKLTVGGTYGVCEITPINPANRVWTATTVRPLHSLGGASWESQIFCPRHVGASEEENDELNANTCLDQEGATIVVSTPAGDVNIVPGRGPVDFGNVCVATNSGRTLGFWSNKNGQALFGSDDLALMVSLNLRNANGSSFNPGSYAQFRTWILKADATNMAYMLSAQMAAMALNVNNGFVDGASYMHIGDAPAGCTVSGLTDGFITVDDLIAAADASLGLYGSTLSGHPQRACQEFMKTALDKGNNNVDGIWVQPAGACAVTYAEDADCSTADIESVVTGVGKGIGPIPDQE